MLLIRAGRCGKSGLTVAHGPDHLSLAFFLSVTLSLSLSLFPVARNGQSGGGPLRLISFPVGITAVSQAINCHRIAAKGATTD